MFTFSIEKQKIKQLNNKIFQLGFELACEYSRHSQEGFAGETSVLHRQKFHIDLNPMTTSIYWAIIAWHDQYEISVFVAQTSDPRSVPNGEERGQTAVFAG